MIRSPSHSGSKTKSGGPGLADANTMTFSMDGVIVSHSDRVARQAADGTASWTHKLRYSGFGPSFVESDGLVVVAYTMQDGLVGVDAVSGENRFLSAWSQPVGAIRNRACRGKVPRVWGGGEPGRGIG